MRRYVVLLILVTTVFVMTQSTTSAQPGLTVSSPEDGETINDTSVTITFEATEFSIVPSTVPLDQAGQRPEANREGEGHVHFMLDLMPIIVWESTEPYTITDVPPGEHTLMVELVNNDHSPLSPPVVQQIRFRSNAEQMLANTGAEQGRANETVVLLILLAGVAALSAGLVLRRKVA
jgi:hypothetical protein